MLLKRLNKSKCLWEIYIGALKNYVLKKQKENNKIKEQPIYNLLDFEYNDVLDYSALIFDDVVGHLCEYLKDRKQDKDVKYKKLYDMRNERWHCDDNVKNKNDYQYVESIINVWISKPFSNEEINDIKKYQIKFGEKLCIYDHDDDESTKLKKSAELIKSLYHKK